MKGIDSWEEKLKEEDKKLLMALKFMVFRLSLSALCLFALIFSVPFTALTAGVVVALSIVISFWVHPLK